MGETRTDLPIDPGYWTRLRNESPMYAQYAAAKGLDMRLQTLDDWGLLVRPGQMSGGQGSSNNPYDSVMATLQGYGNAQQANLKQNYQNALGNGMQSLASTGLAGTTVAPSIKMGFMKQYQNALNDLNQNIMHTKAGYQMQGAQMAQQNAQFYSNLALGYAGLYTRG